MTPVGRPAGRCEQLAKRRPASLDREGRMGDQAVRLDPRGKERLSAALRLVPGGQGRPITGRKADAAVSELEQVLRRELPRGTLVDPDGRHLERLARAVHGDEPGALLTEPDVVPMIRAQVGQLARDEDHPVDPPLEQHVHVLRFPDGGAGGVAQDRRIPRLRGAVLHRLRERREDGVAELGDEEPDHAGRVGLARHVEELAHGALDALACLGPNARGAARDTRGRGDTNSGLLCDVSKSGSHVSPWSNR